MHTTSISSSRTISSHLQLFGVGFPSQVFVRVKYLSKSWPIIGAKIVNTQWLQVLVKLFDHSETFTTPTMGKNLVRFRDVGVKQPAFFLYELRTPNDSYLIHSINLDLIIVSFMRLQLAQIRFLAQLTQNRLPMHTHFNASNATISN